MISRPGKSRANLPQFKLLFKADAEASSDSSKEQRVNRKQRRAEQKTAGRMPSGTGAAPRPHDADRLNDRALQSHSQGDTAGAIALLRQAIALKPDRAIYHNNLGELLRLTGQTDPALASLEQAIALNPDYAEAHNNRGNLLRQLQRPADAIVSYRKALALKPAYAEAMNNLAAALIDAVSGFLPEGTLPRQAHIAAASALFAGYLSGRAWTIGTRAARSPHVDLEHP